MFEKYIARNLYTYFGSMVTVGALGSWFAILLMSKLGLLAIFMLVPPAVWIVGLTLPEE